MPTANAGTGSNFWNGIVNAAQGITGAIDATRPLWTGSVFNSNPGQVQNQPTYAGQPNSNTATTAAVAPAEMQQPNYTPFVIGAAVILLIIVVAKT